MTYNIGMNEIPNFDNKILNYLFSLREDDGLADDGGVMSMLAYALDRMGGKIVDETEYDELVLRIAGDQRMTPAEVREALDAWDEYIREGEE